MMARNEKSCIRFCLETLAACSLLLSCYTQGRVTLTPSTMISVCAGDQLELTCNTSTDIHQWSIADSNTGTMYTRLIAVSSGITQVTPIHVQSFTFNFTIISPPDALPLISTLSVDGTSTYLNLTRISCLERDSGNMQTVNIRIFGSDSVESIPLNYDLDLDFGITNVTVLLSFEEGRQDEVNPLVSYSVTTSSQPEVLSQGRTGFQLVVPYNAQINASIVVSLCGQNSAPTIIQLNYTNCGYPLEKSSNISESVIIGYDISSDWPIMEGTNATFSCSHDFVRTGPAISTCMTNGEWVPNPRGVMCRHKDIANCGPPPTPERSHVYPFASTLEGANVVFTCSKSVQGSLNTLSMINSTAVCNENGTWVPNPSDILMTLCHTENSNSGVETSVWTDDVMLAIISSSVTFILTTLFCFTIGFINGLVLSRKCPKAGCSRRSVDVTARPAINYEDILPKEMWQSEKGMELRENEAYGSIQQ